MSDVPVSKDIRVQISQRIAAEPAFKTVLYKILDYCDTPRSLKEIEGTVCAFPEMRAAWQTPQVLLRWLAQAGGIEQLETESGGETMWQTTQSGRKAVTNESHNNNSRISQLLSLEESYRDIYIKILESCINPKTRAEIEAMLKGEPALENSKVYASYFIDKLENAKGLIWNGKWETSKIGMSFIV